MFRITSGKGFHIKLENGITISTQLGGGSYCSNYEKDILRYRGSIESNDAEISIWNKKGEWITKEVLKEVIKDDIGWDVVYGYCKMGLWLKIIDYCKGLKGKITGENK
ncbi:MAG: hypothetical protein JSW06_02835 [Thermoplasmatales archaeon]|nr:MAG: hypothetical protein JSW06_02835 [Thermoplasmatales archaeon]